MMWSSVTGHTIWLETLTTSGHMGTAGENVFILSDTPWQQPEVVSYTQRIDRLTVQCYLQPASFFSTTNFRVQTAQRSRTWWTDLPTTATISATATSKFNTASGWTIDRYIRFFEETDINIFFERTIRSLSYQLFMTGLWCFRCMIYEAEINVWQFLIGLLENLLKQNVSDNPRPTASLVIYISSYPARPRRITVKRSSDISELHCSFCCLRMYLFKYTSKMLWETL